MRLVTIVGININSSVVKSNEHRVG